MEASRRRADDLEELLEANGAEVEAIFDRRGEERARFRDPGEEAHRTIRRDPDVLATVVDLERRLAQRTGDDQDHGHVNGAVSPEVAEPTALDSAAVLEDVGLASSAGPAVYDWCSLDELDLDDADIGELQQALEPVLRSTDPPGGAYLASALPATMASSLQRARHQDLDALLASLLDVLDRAGAPAPADDAVVTQEAFDRFWSAKADPAAPAKAVPRREHVSAQVLIPMVLMLAALAAILVFIG